MNMCICTYDALWTYRVFSWCSPRNILFEISFILFSPNCKSCMRDAPSKAFGSMPVSWLRFSSSLTRCGNRPNRPSELMRPNSLSLSKLWKQTHTHTDTHMVRFKLMLNVSCLFTANYKLFEHNKSEAIWYLMNEFDMFAFILLLKISFKGILGCRRN